MDVDGSGIPGRWRVRHHSIISWEIDRNGGAAAYRAANAQHRCDANRLRPKEREMEASTQLYDAVNKDMRIGVHRNRSASPQATHHGCFRPGTAPPGGQQAPGDLHHPGNSSPKPRRRPRHRHGGKVRLCAGFGKWSRDSPGSSIFDSSRKTFQNESARAVDTPCYQPPLNRRRRARVPEDRRPRPSSMGRGKQ